MHPCIKTLYSVLRRLQTMKYGVIRTALLLSDLADWDALYVVLAAPAGSFDLLRTPDCSDWGSGLGLRVGRSELQRGDSLPYRERSVSTFHC